MTQDVKLLEISIMLNHQLIVPVDRSQNQFPDRILQLIECQGSSVATNWPIFYIKTPTIKDVTFAEIDFRYNHYRTDKNMI